MERRLLGEVFIHRNIGSLVHTMDLNGYGVIQYAVAELHVSDVIVGGHYDCDMLNSWPGSNKDICSNNPAKFVFPDKQGKIDRLCELQRTGKTSVKTMKYSGNGRAANRLPYMVPSTASATAACTI